MHQRDNKVLIYISQNLNKVAECKVKPYELVQRKDENIKVDVCIKSVVKEQDTKNNIDKEVESKLEDEN